MAVVPGVYSRWQCDPTLEWMRTDVSTAEPRFPVSGWLPLRHTQSSAPIMTEAKQQPAGSRRNSAVCFLPCMRWDRAHVSVQLK